MTQLSPAAAAITRTVLLAPGIRGEDLVHDAAVQLHLPTEPTAALEVFSVAASYCRVDRDGRWWPTKPAALLRPRDKVQSSPHTNDQPDPGDWREISGVSGVRSDGTVDVTFGVADGFILAGWDHVSGDTVVLYLPG
ncbi:hypothetical protein [uncultured Williamsia sp.]|uniref:hypothetical protein n=1 Tax=uncultured Williamsia sp. TaxID=259311 RepID=UPI002611D357|nr:hypothetical protein [uncultured Williamsia sp.]